MIFRCEGKRYFEAKVATAVVRVHAAIQPTYHCTLPHGPSRHRCRAVRVLYTVPCAKGHGRVLTLGQAQR